MRRILWLALAAASTAGPLLPRAEAGAAALERVAETAHARYYAVGGQKVDVRRNEAFLARLLSVFGPVPDGWRIEYYRHASVAELQAQVGFAAYGVTDLDSLRIDSVRAYHPHELVHAVAGRLGRPPLLFTEGLAVALTSEGVVAGRDVDAVARGYMEARGTIRPLLVAFAEEDPDTDYAVAGSFVAFLLDRHGIEPMIAFLRGCDGPSSRYEDAFRSAYGRSVTAVAAEWDRSLRETRSARGRDWYDARGWPATLQHRSPAAQPQNASLAPSDAQASREPQASVLLSMTR